MWESHSCPNSPRDSQGRLEPSARRPRFPDAARRGVTKAPPPAGAAHLKAWPRRWACARRWAWRGSFCPFPSPLLAAEASPEEGPRRGGPPRARSLIHSSAARGPGPKGPAGRAGLQGPRERRLGSAGRIGLADPRGSLTGGPRNPVPHCRQGRPGSEANFRAATSGTPGSKTARRGGRAGSARGRDACVLPAAPSGGGRPAWPRSCRSFSEEVGAVTVSAGELTFFSDMPADTRLGRVASEFKSTRAGSSESYSPTYGSKGRAGDGE